MDLANAYIEEESNGLNCYQLPQQKLYFLYSVRTDAFSAFPSMTFRARLIAQMRKTHMFWILGSSLRSANFMSAHV